MKGLLKMFFKKKKKIFHIIWTDRYGGEFNQVILSTTKQKAVIVLCENFSVGKILSVEELIYE